jgi:hypothetical protein
MHQPFQLEGQREVNIRILLIIYKESEAFQKLQVPGPGSYLNEVKEKIILHDGAYRTPGGK